MSIHRRQWCRRYHTPCPVKVTDCPVVAGLGVMESMVAVGGVLEGEVTVTLLVTGVDQAPSSSLTRNDMVWVPAEREDVEKVLAVDRIPLMLDVHS